MVYRDSEAEYSESLFEEDAGAPGSEKKLSIVLERPHTLLLMSTVEGGKAVRGAFTGAMSTQFTKADGKITIEEMVTNAVRDMKQREPDRYNQTPERRNTLQKSLILPPVKLSTSSQPPHSTLSKERLLATLGLFRH